MEKIGLIGQGFIGKHLADDFVERGFDVVRYSLDPDHVGNRDFIPLCDFVFIAVPTPTTKKGCDVSIIESVLPLIGKGKVAVIKSTVTPGTTKRLQEKFSDIVVFHSPEFLRERHASADARKPTRNIIGLPIFDEYHETLANTVMDILPEAPYKFVCRAEEAELTKYGSNIFLAMKVIYMNLIYDLAEAYGVDYSVVAEAMSKDDRIGQSHMNVIDASGHSDVLGRGAGGHCFPKDLAALRILYEEKLGHDATGLGLLRALEEKNKCLLINTKKDLDLLQSIYEDPDLQ
jgi:UDPglucose 6-dehydrogenase